MRYHLQQPKDRRPDASMDLLRKVIDEAVEPEYAAVAARTTRRHHPVYTALALFLVGGLVATGFIQTLQAAPAAAQERSRLISEITRLEGNLTRTQAEVDRARGETADLQQRALGSDAQARQLQRDIDTLSGPAGAVAVSGPGVAIVVDDGTGREQANRVLDRDLQLLVNGLWQAGAEAISINGHRLSATSAIRNAGDAITVDYRSLNRPYRVEAIGDPRTLEARLADTLGGQLWASLARNYQMRYEITRQDRLVLREDSTITLRFATVAR
ncbi:DUF881 domain-containing protein [Granulicoccus phenolivorans]|uniref:DUF881 domain-containing protein n=1 Tax=Granulicoccus phenolivorans TaxID=266854 RepID=UPI0004267856|nr:DUF881 domain-containing protein [Granulicoccus phenolivorans]